LLEINVGISEFCLLVKGKFNISELYCIGKKCEIKFKLCILELLKIVCLNDEPVNRKAFSNESKNVEDDKTVFQTFYFM
jgi:hypothetical protein